MLVSVCRANNHVRVPPFLSTVLQFAIWWLCSDTSGWLRLHFPGDIREARFIFLFQLLVINWFISYLRFLYGGVPPQVLYSLLYQVFIVLVWAAQTAELVADDWGPSASSQQALGAVGWRRVSEAGREEPHEAALPSQVTFSA